MEVRVGSVFIFNRDLVDQFQAKVVGYIPEETEKVMVIKKETLETWHCHVAIVDLRRFRTNIEGKSYTLPFEDYYICVPVNATAEQIAKAKKFKTVTKRSRRAEGKVRIKARRKAPPRNDLPHAA